MLEIHNTKVNYIQYGKGRDIVLLHGWGQNIEMMKFLGDPLSKNYRVTILDLPGFGESVEPDTVWTVYDYADMLYELVEKLSIKNPILIGHSFGGRIAICYASKYDVKKVILFGAPCVRNKKISIKEKLLKSAKKLPLMDTLGEKMKNYIGSTDYKNASPKMREILVHTVNEDLSDCAKKIDVPTLLIWGNRDEAAPLEDAKLLENLLPDGGLVVLDGTHYLYIERLPQVLNIIYNFLEG